MAVDQTAENGAKASVGVPGSMTVGGEAGIRIETSCREICSYFVLETQIRNCHIAHAYIA